MEFIVFILVYPLIWLLSLLPMRVLHLLSDFLFLILYYVIGYRKKVVFNNLKKVFPEKTDKELTEISKKSLRHFLDTFMEIIKSFSISKEEMSKRYQFTNLEALKEVEATGKSSVLLGGHYANWEWIFNLNFKVKSKGFALYTKIQNEYFDKKVRQSRGKFNTTMVVTSDTTKVIQENAANNIQSMYGFLGDQSPQSYKARYWSSFLGVDNLPIHTGAEFFAKKYDLAVVLFLTERIKRSYYRTTFEVITLNPKEFEDYKITDYFLEKFGEHIKKQPEFYFWTHKRFKHEGENLKGTK